MRVELKGSDFESGVAEEMYAVFDILDFEKDIAFDILFSAENLTGKVLFLGISKDFSNHILIKLFLEFAESV